MTLSKKTHVQTGDRLRAWASFFVALDIPLLFYERSTTELKVAHYRVASVLRTKISSYLPHNAVFHNHEIFCIFCRTRLLIVLHGTPTEYY